MIRRWLAERLCSELVLARWRRTALKNKVIVLMYHEVLEDCSPIEAWTVIRESDLRRQLEYVKQEFQVVPLKDAIGALSRPAGADKPLIVITFDDGYKGNRRIVMPIVEKLELPITIFVSTAAVQGQFLYWYDRIILAGQAANGRKTRLDLTRWGLRSYDFRFKGTTDERQWVAIDTLLRDLKSLEPQMRAAAVDDALNQWEAPAVDHTGLWPLSIQEVAELAESPFVTIGAHSHCHNRLVQLDEGQIRESVGTSKQLLEEWTGQTVDLFAYPNGDHDDRVVSAVQALGFRCGLGVDSRPWGVNDSLFSIPRIGIGRFDSYDMFRAKVSGVGFL